MANIFDGLIDETRLQEEPILKRYGKQFVRGATLGFAGSKYAPEGIGEHVAEFAGGILPVAAISAVASPVAGAGLRLLNVPKLAIPLTSRLATASAVGAGTTAGYDLSQEGETSLGRVGLGAGLGIAQEALFLGGTKLAKKAMARGKIKIPEPSPTAPVTSDVIDETVSSVKSTPPIQGQLALPPAGGETVLPSSGTIFDVPPQKGLQYTTKLGGQGTFKEQGITAKPSNLKYTVEDVAGTRDIITQQNIEQTKTKFYVGRDPETKLTELISKDNLTDSAIDLASRNQGTGIAGGPIKPQILNVQSKAKLDLNAKSEPVKMENILKEPDAQSQLLLNLETPPKMADFVKLNYTPEAMETLMIAKKIDMSDDILTAMMEASQQIKDPIKRNKIILDELKRFCAGG